MEDPSSVAERIAQARDIAGLTQQELGDAIGVSKRMVYDYEKGNVTPYRHLEAIALATGATTEWLLTGTSIEDRLRQLEDEREQVRAEVRETLAEVRRLVRDLMRPPAGLLPRDEDTPSNAPNPDEPETPGEDLRPPST